MHNQTDVLIIGSGAAGLSLALRLGAHLKVAIISKLNLTEGATRYAQGGISAVQDSHDSLDNHIHDTLEAGAGLCDPKTVSRVVTRAPQIIEWLVKLGVKFTRVDARNKTDYHLHQEGGHSHRRILHAGDATGYAIVATLERHVRQNPNITIYEHHTGIDLITARQLGDSYDYCHGVYLLDSKTGKINTLAAKCTILATGGAGKLYLYTSNPDTCTGDGVAMGYRAGADIANMEFVQFHPTCLHHPHAGSFLISEAVRGEGGKLRLPNGAMFIQRFHPDGDMASRDIVARAIDHEMKRLGLDYVHLDISHRDTRFITQHFPTIYKRCLELGYDMTKEPLPVVPAAHYFCGGILVNENAKTTLPGLYAIGEASCSGLHGANRLASNSLLECLVYAEIASADILSHISTLPSPPLLPNWDESQVTDSDEEVVVAHNWDEIRRFMWDYVGIVRTSKRLIRAHHRIQLLAAEIDEYYQNFRISSDLIELRNLIVIAKLVVDSALQRKESRGLHFTLDYPTAQEAAPPKNTVISKMQITRL